MSDEKTPRDDEPTQGSAGNEQDEQPPTTDSAEEAAGTQPSNGTDAAPQGAAPATPPPSPQPPYTPPMPPPAPPRLVRRSEGKVVAGVCSGLAAYTGIDAVAWRIGFVVLALTGGAGVLAYIVMWLIMPSARPGEPVAPARPGSTQSGRWVAIALIVFGLLLLSRNIFEFKGGIFWAVLLVGIGVAMWGRDLAPRSSPPPPPPPPGVPPMTPMPTPPSAVASTDWPGSAPTTPLPPVPAATATATSPVPYEAAATASRTGSSQPDPRSRRDPSILGRLVVGAAALALGIGLVIENAGVDMSAKLYIEILLWIVGAGLIVGAWWGRARWLIFPGAFLSLCLVAFALTPPAFWDGHFGERVWQPTSFAELQDEYSLSAGEAVLDLSRLDFGKRARELEVDVAFGELLVVVPEEVPVRVEARVQGGEMNLFGQTGAGWDNDRVVMSEGDEDVGELALDAEVGFGELTVRRVTPTDNFEPRLNGDRNRFDFDFRFRDRDRNGDRGNR